MLYCFHCGHKITSTEHADCCTTIKMLQFIEKSDTTINELKHKPMMTYGLNGCTAIIILVYKSNEPFKIIFGHDPDRNNVSKKILETIRKHITCTFKVLVKCPGEYRQKDNGYYDFFPKITQERDMLDGIENIDIKYEPYCLATDEYTNKELYLKLVDKKFMYTDNYSNYVTL